MKSFKVISIYLISLPLLANDLLIQKAVNGMSGYSDRVIMMTGEEIKSQIDPVSFQRKLDFKTSGAPLFQTDNREVEDYLREQKLSNFETTYTKYQVDYQNMSHKNSVLKEKSAVVNLSVVGGAAFIGTGILTGGTSVVVSVGAAVAGTVAAEVANIGFDAIAKENQKKITSVVTDFIKKEVGTEKEYLLREMTPESAKTVVKKFKLQEKLEKNLFCDTCSTEEKDMIRVAALANLSNIAKGNTAAIEGLKNNLNQTTQEVANNRAKLQVLANVVTNYQKITDQSIQKLQVSQTEINNKLSDLQDKVYKNIDATKANTNAIHKNTEDINFLKDFMFSKMNPREKIAAIESGALKVNFADDKIVLLRLQANFQKHAGDTLTGINQIKTISDNLGMKLPGEFNKALAFGNKAYSAIDGALSSLQSGGPLGYMGAVASITGMFAKSRDVGAERHAQVMQALGVINKKLDKVLDNQKLILENQAKIFGKLEDIEKRIVETATYLYDAIELTRNDLRYQTIALKQLTGSDLSNCENFISRMNILTASETTMKSLWQRKISFFSNDNNKKIFSECTGINEDLSLLRIKNEPSANFLLGLQKSLDGTLSNSLYIEKYYKVLLNFQERLSRNSKISYAMSLNNFTNVYDYHTFYSKIKKVPESIEDTFSGDDWEDNGQQLDIPELISEPFSYPSILKMASTVNNVYTYFDLVNNNSLPTIEELANSSGLGVSSPGYILLNDAKMHLQVTLLQMGLLSGMSFIPQVYDNLEDQSLINDLNKILKLSPTIQSNFISYLVMNKYKKYTKSEYNPSLKKNLFDFALEKKDLNKLNVMLEVSASSIHRVQCSEKCVLLIGNEAYDLKATEDQGNTVKHHPLLGSVIGMLSFTNENILGYQVHKKMVSEGSLDAKAYRVLLLKSSTAHQ